MKNVSVQIKFEERSSVVRVFFLTYNRSANLMIALSMLS